MLVLNLNTRFLGIGFIVFLFVLIGSAYAAPIFVDHFSGDDTTGDGTSWSSSYKTLGKALGQSVGSTVSGAREILLKYESGSSPVDYVHQSADITNHVGNAVALMLTGNGAIRISSDDGTATDFDSATPNPAKCRIKGQGTRWDLSLSSALYPYPETKAGAVADGNVFDFKGVTLWYDLTTITTDVNQTSGNLYTINTGVVANFDRCIFYNNKGGGIVRTMGGWSTFENCLFYANVASKAYGGRGAIFFNGNVDLINTTVSGNAAGSGVDTIFTLVDDLSVVNSIITGNNERELIEFSTTASFENSAVERDIPSGSITVTDPVTITDGVSPLKNKNSDNWWQPPTAEVLSMNYEIDTTNSSGLAVQSAGQNRAGLSYDLTGVAYQDNPDLGAIQYVPPILGPKVRQRLKEYVFGDLPHNPTMAQLKQKNLDSVNHLDLYHLGGTSDKLILDGIVEHLPNVERIDLTGTEFDSLQPLDGHSKLRHLNLNYGPTRTSAQLDTLFEKDDGSPINLPELDQLDLNNTGFSQVDQLAHLGKLRHLELRQNGIDQSSGTDPLLGLDNLVNLQYLIISQNPAINDISEIKKLYQAKIQAVIDKEHHEWGVDAAPAANQVAMDHDAGHNPKPYLKIEAQETSISASDAQELVDMGVRLFTLPQEHAKVNLRRGINMIGLPLDNRENMKANDLINWFVRTPVNTNQVVETKADVTSSANILNWSHSGILDRLSADPTLVSFKLSVLPIDGRYFDYIPMDIYKGSANYDAGGHSTTFFVYDDVEGTLIPVVQDHRGWVPIATSAGTEAGGLKIQGGSVLNVSGDTTANPVHTSAPYSDTNNWDDQNGNGWDDRGLAELLAEAVTLDEVKDILDDAEQTIRYQYLLGIRANFDDQNGSGSQGMHVMFAQGENGNLKLIQYTDVGWIVRYQSEIDSNTGTGRFETHVPDLDGRHAESFPIRGGEAYIIHVGSNRVINFDGQAWVGQIDSQHSGYSTAPSATIGTNTWAFLVAGKLTTEVVAVDEPYTLRATNLRSGKQLAKVKHQGHSFRLPLVDLSRQDIVAEGDLIKVEVVGDDGQRLADGQFVVGQQEIAAAYRLVKIQYNPVPELTRLLQNYPNPFNPETWIPFELNQDAEVLIKIYDVTGHSVRTLPVGFQPAGIYSSRTKAAYWDGKTETGETVASGIYFYNITIGDYSQTRRMVILK